MRVKVLIRPCYAEKFHHKNHDYVKKNCHFHCAFVAVNSIFLLRLELTIWSCAVHVQILEKIKFVIFVLKLSVCLILGPLRSVWAKYLRVFKSTLFNYQIILIAFFFASLFLNVSQEEGQVKIYLDNPKELCMVRVKNVD